MIDPADFPVLEMTEEQMQALEAYIEAVNRLVAANKWDRQRFRYFLRACDRALEKQELAERGYDVA